MSSNDLNPTAEAMVSKFNSRIVTILVGPEEFPFCIHETLLLDERAGALLNGAFEDGARAAGTGRMELPEDEPAEFECFVRWLYCMPTVPYVIDIGYFDLGPSQLLKLYTFAYRNLIHQLQDEIMVEMCNKQPLMTWHCGRFDREVLEHFVAEVSDGSAMHEFLAQWFLHDGCRHIATTCSRKGTKMNESEDVPPVVLRLVMKHILECNLSNPLAEDEKLHF
ncbi:hypothetical protein Daus18300_007285 [Diaporthe australafricana]|uniref:BTB domain-containing protein n=1 Tax=Diaporthe australafricana TaxID=127596 RepID=A0ABR3WNQ6_9PEZI